MEVPPRAIAIRDPALLACEAQRLASNLSGLWWWESPPDTLIEQVTALSQQILPMTGNPGVASACGLLSDAYPKNI